MINNSIHNTNQSDRFRVADASGIPVPSRSQVIEFLSSLDEPAALKEIAASFRLKGQKSFMALGSRLERLCQRGLLERVHSGKFQLADRGSLVLGTVTGHADGYGFVVPDDGGDHLYLGKRQVKRVLHGDRVLCRVTRTDNKGRLAGEIVEVLIDHDRQIIGKFETIHGAPAIIPDDPRYCRTISIPRAATLGSQDGDIVLVKVTGHPVEQEHVSGEIVEIIGAEHDPGIKSEIAIRKYELPHIWPDDVISQVTELAEELMIPGSSNHRTDLTDLPFITIDGVDARDFDDAVYCEATDSRWRLVVAIADVSHYVPANSPLDVEAYHRGTSVYFPDRVVPMLPEQLSNDICSLNPHEDRNCMVCDMQVDSSGKVTRYQFYQGTIRSQARLTYDIVNEIVTNPASNQRAAWGTLSENLDCLFMLSGKLRKNRESNGAIDFNFPEPFVEFDAENRISSITARERKDSHRLIEECMLAANVCAAQLIQENLGDGGIYRNHEGPDRDGLLKIRQFLSGLGLSLGGQSKPGAADYQNLLKQVEASPEILVVVQTVLLRSLSQAVYSPEQSGHFALAFPVYTHFTSPIRRYSDLVVHRLIKSLIGLKKYGQPGPDGITIKEIGEQCSMTERRAEEACYDVIGWLKAEFMSSKIGESFYGVISGVREFGVFVQLQDFFVDGLVHVTRLGNDYYHFDPVHQKLQGERFGEVFKLGDKVKVVVAGVDLDESKIDFDLSGSFAVEARKRPGRKPRKQRRSKSGKFKH